MIDFDLATPRRLSRCCYCHIAIGQHTRLFAHIGEFERVLSSAYLCILLRSGLVSENLFMRSGPVRPGLLGWRVRRDFHFEACADLGTWIFRHSARCTSQ